MVIFFLMMFGIMLGVALGVVGYPLVLMGTARREYEQASQDAEREWTRTTVTPLEPSRAELLPTEHLAVEPRP